MSSPTKQTDRVTACVEVGIDPQSAFDLFTKEIDAWWHRGPHDFYDGQRAQAVRFEPGVGGRYLEVYDDSVEDALEIGRITLWEPGRRLVWRMSLDDTEVDVRFEATSQGTRVVLEQRIIAGGVKAHFYSGWRHILGWFGDWSLKRALTGSPAPAGNVATCDSQITSASVARFFGLGGPQATWLANLDTVRPSTSLELPSADQLSDLLSKLGVADEDASEILRALPSPSQTPEAWWLLERSSYVFSRGLAHHDITRPRRPEGEATPMLDWTMWSKEPHLLPSELRLFPIHLILANIGSIRGCHQQFGIPNEISVNTLSYLERSIAAYRQTHGRTGAQISRWQWLRFLGWLYEVGRLEVSHYRIRTYPKEAGPLFWYDDTNLEPGFRIGDPALSIHIPAGEPLEPKAVDEDFRRLRRAFMRVYPDEPLSIATCTSWLLDEQLGEYLPPESNIMAFQKRFTLVPGARNDDGITQAVFGTPHLTELDVLPQRTALQRALVRHLRSGRSWRMRTGWVGLSD